VSELKMSITFSEFLEWCEFLNWEDERQTKLDTYLAQIAAEIRRGQVKHPRNVRISDLLLTKAKRKIDSKAVWLAHMFTAIKPKK